MQALQVKLDRRTFTKLDDLHKLAERDGEYRVARRILAIRMNAQGQTAGEISRLLGVHRSSATLWLQHWMEHGLDGILEGQRSGRPAELDAKDIELLKDIVDSGPIAYGFTSGVWTSPMITRVIADEFGIRYHPGHVRKLLHEIGFSVQRPRRKLARADVKKQSRWRRYTLPALKKTPKPKERKFSTRTKPRSAKTRRSTKLGRR
jgi:transposase